MHLGLDMLVFDEAERGPSDDLALQFEAVSHMPDEERRYQGPARRDDHQVPVQADDVEPEQLGRRCRLAAK